MRMRFYVAMLAACAVASAAHAAPPADQDIWTFVKDGLKDDLTLISLGMNAGFRVMIPGYAEFEDLATEGWDSGKFAEGAGSASEAAAGQLKDIVKDPSHPLYQSARQLRKNSPWLSKFKSRNLTKSSRRLFKVAGALHWITAGFDAYSEIRDATVLAMEYQKAREAEYRIRRQKSLASQPQPQNPAKVEPSRKPSVRGGENAGKKKVDAAPPSAPRAAFRLRRVPPEQADLVFMLDEGNATITPNSAFSYALATYRLENRLPYHVIQCVVYFAGKSGMGQSLVFKDIPPGGSSTCETALVGSSVEDDMLGEHFVFPALIIAMKDGEVVDLYDEPQVPSIGCRPTKQ